jgi:CspA family cold shock protein
MRSPARWRLASANHGYHCNNGDFAYIGYVEFHVCLAFRLLRLPKTTPDLNNGLPDRRAVYMRIVAFSKEANMANGTVKWFNAQKGFGFIQPSDGDKDVFVHISAVERAGASTLNEGQKVSYDVVNERGKSAAANLKLG